MQHRAVHDGALGAEADRRGDLGGLDEAAEGLQAEELLAERRIRVDDLGTMARGGREAVGARASASSPRRRRSRRERARGRGRREALDTCRSISVAVKPGQTHAVCTPLPARSWHVARMSPASACFDVTYLNKGGGEGGRGG